MNARDWKAAPVPTPDIAYDLARRYTIETETYDRTVCTGPVVRGEIMPVGYREIYAVGANAAKVRSRLEPEALSAGLTWRDVNQAMRSYESSQQFFDDMAAIP